MAESRSSATHDEADPHESEADIESDRGTGTVSASDRVIARFGDRFVAWMVDASLLFAFQWLVVIVVARQLQAAGMVVSEPCEPDSPFFCEGPNTALWVIIALIVAITTFGFHAYFDGRLGATPGKRYMGLRVVDAAGPGNGIDPDLPIGFGRGLVRSAVRQSVWLWVFLFVGASPISVDVPSVVWFVLLAVSLSTLVRAALAEDARGWHDIAASTSVTYGGEPQVSTTPTPDADATTIENEDQ